MSRFYECQSWYYFYRLPAAGQQEVRFFLGEEEGPSCRIAVKAVGSSQSSLLMKQKCCRSNLQLGQHPIDGADGTTDGAKLQNYRISCCKQPKKFGDEAESVVKAICSWDSHLQMALSYRITE